MAETPIFDMNMRVSGLEQAIRVTAAITPSFTGAVINDGLRSVGRLMVPSKGSGPLASATPRNTGKLARSTFFDVLRLGGSQVLRIMQPARTSPEYGSKFYGGFVRTGTKKHTIRPRLKSVLRWQIGNNVFFATSVEHPGTKPNPYHIRTFNLLKSPIQAIINRMTNRLTEKYRTVR